MINDYELYDEAQSSEVDILLKEFQDKCLGILTNNVNSEVAKIEAANAKLLAENEALKAKVDSLTTELDNAKRATSESDINVKVLQLFKNKFLKNNADKTSVYTLLKLLFEKDYEEDLYNVPLWLGVLTQYYSHKNEAIEILRALDVNLPDNVETFRLPLDWTEEELDIFFSTMYNHINTNMCIYESNLCYWAPTALRSVEYQCCKTNHSNIPWQYILRNPLLKKEKYLTQIGSKMFTKLSLAWSNFAKIDKYLDLNEQELDCIIKNVDATQIKNAGDDNLYFLLTHLNLIKREDLLDAIYDRMENSYAFRSNHKFFDMPFKYVERWCKDHKDDIIYLLQGKKFKELLTQEQRLKIATIAFTEGA